MPDETEQADYPAQIRAAITALDFGKAGELWDVYAARLEAALHDRSLSAEELADVGELVKSSRMLVLAARAQSREHLRCVRATAAYRAGEFLDPNPL
jgi:hypothetical protein